MELKTLCLMVVLFPLFASILVGLLNKKISKTLSHRITILAVFVSFICSCFIFYQLLKGNDSSQSISIYTWGILGNVKLEMGFLIDRLSTLMMIVVSFVSWMVHIYTIGYMKEDPGYQRFFSYISAFTFGMLMLVMSNNFLQLFFGWEAVGLMSYLLIGFWYQKESATFASLKAFLVNRIGDMGFILGISAIFYYFGSLDYLSIFQKAEFIAANKTMMNLFYSVDVSVITFICICLFIGAMGKSAQMPLHVWLPDSMEGPTPISALIHAATMVTAGVFMVARMSPLYEYSDVALNFILIIGAITCLLTSILAITQSDIKRIIAYSTLSQLGYMMIAMGASAYGVGIFHLMTHAFFKALLFLAAGSVIIAMHHEQDIWKMGNLRKYMPITYITMLIGFLSMIGLPFLAGFYSKDLIIEAVHFANLPASKFAYWVVLFCVLITSVYSFRLFFVVFHGEERMDQKTLSHLHESPPVIYWPLILLAIPSIVAGLIFEGPLLNNFFMNSLSVQHRHPAMDRLHDEFPSAIEMAWHGFITAPFILAIIGFVIAWLCYIRYPMWPSKIRQSLGFVYTIFRKKYGFDILYDVFVVRFIQFLGSLFWRVGDQFAIDGIGVNGSANTVSKLAKIGKSFQTGYLYHYAFVMITGFLVLFIWLMVV